MSIVIGLSEEHETNLRKLAAYLKLPVLEAEFDMEVFSESNSLYTREKTCGSVGCAIGHGPYAGVSKEYGEDWEPYSDRVFGLGNRAAEWSWCFGANWACIDNTPVGAAKRIEWLLNRGLPENWEDQVNGVADLCYAL